MYRRGAQFEREIRKRLEAKGYQVVRSAGSKGKSDMWAAGHGKLLMIQCKTGKSYSISAILRSEDVKTLIKKSIDTGLSGVVRCLVMIRRQRITYQLLWTGRRWKPVQII